MSRNYDGSRMEILRLLIVGMAFAFAAGYAYAKGKRVLGIGLIALGIGGAMAQNPVQTTLGEAYGAIGLTLFLAGIAIIIGWGAFHGPSLRTSTTGES